MGRPTDWCEVFGFDDPTPGEPGTVVAVTRTWSRLADAAEDAERAVRGLLGDAVLSTWIGEGGAAFREKVDGLPDQLGKCQRSYRLAADALGRWGPQLAAHQDTADGALLRGRMAKDDLVAAQALVAAAAGSPVLDLVGRVAGGVPPSGVPVPSPSEIAAARSRLVAAESAQTDAQARLDAARRLAEEAGVLRAEDGRVAAARVREASDAGIAERSRWDRFTDWAGAAWDVVVEIAKVVVVVLGIVALIIGGPLAWVVFAAAMVVLADTLAKYLQGKASRWDVLFAALACIPATKGLTTLGELSSAYAMGGTLTATSHVLSSGKTALIDIAAGVRSLGSGTKTLIWTHKGMTLLGADLAMTRLFAQDATRFEPGITRHLETIVAQLPTSHLEGLENRLKTFDSLARKTATDLETVQLDQVVKVDNVLGKTADAVRYTVVTEPADFTAASSAALHQLAGDFETIGVSNTFGSQGPYRGLNTQWRDPVSGQIFEVQFHSPESFRIKTLTHPWYEEARLPETTPERKAFLDQKQIDAYVDFEAPAGSAEITVPSTAQSGQKWPFAHLDRADLWSKPPVVVGVAGTGPQIGDQP
ncbi:MAG: hypothetical protein ACRCYU_17675 [Nocardioides sp.]